MAIKPQVALLLDKKMDRADFLKHVGIGLLALTGVAGVLRSFGVAPSLGSTQSYGTSAYGGTKRD